MSCSMLFAAESPLHIIEINVEGTSSQESNPGRHTKDILETFTESEGDSELDIDENNDRGIPPS